MLIEVLWIFRIVRKVYTKIFHFAFGYTAGLLVIFRIIWGFIGSRYARFSDFIKGPKAIIHHVINVFKGNLAEPYLGNNPAGKIVHHFINIAKGKSEELYLGHNPAGAIVMISLMALTLITVATGYLCLTLFFG